MAGLFSRSKLSRAQRRSRPTLEALEGRLVPALAVPEYSSLPGATATLYLDFDGDVQPQWGTASNITTPAFDTDADPANFSQSELNAISDIYRYVAEDYAPFNLNVTTVNPGNLADGVALKVVIGGDGSWTGGTMGGISYVGAFTNSAPNVSFVFPANLANTTRYIADAAAHEAGHGFGLDHQSKYAGGVMTVAYSAGPGDDTAPLLGVSYLVSRGLWWYGTSEASATTFQNDMEVLASAANGFGYRADDHGDSAATATALTVSPSGAVSGSGVITKMTDLDYFSFTTGSATIALNVTIPAPYNNLDARVELRDASGNLVASADPSTSYSATINYAATAGTYYLVVASHGVSANATSTSYGFNVGTYTLSGTVTPAGASAPAAASNLSASAASSSSINLSWADNSDNETGFQIERLVNGIWTQVGTVGTNVTSWQNTGLAAGTSYSYRVRAYNAAGHSAYSNTGSASTSSAASAPSAPTSLAASVKTKPRTQVALSWRDTSSNETGFYVDRSADGGATWVRIAQLAANATSYADSSVSSGKTYLYRACAFNSTGASGYSNVASVTVGGRSPKSAAPVAALALSGADLVGPAVTATQPALAGEWFGLVGVPAPSAGPFAPERASPPARAEIPQPAGPSTEVSSPVRREQTQAKEDLPSRPATPGHRGGLTAESLSLYFKLGGTF